jgi:hypothetical protein
VIDFGIPPKTGCLCFQGDDLVGVLHLIQAEGSGPSPRRRLSSTFAEQAVFATESARLLNELRRRTNDLSPRTNDLSEAQEQQTATSEVLLPPRVADLIAPPVQRSNSKAIASVEPNNSDSLLRFGALV